MRVLAPAATARPDWRAVLELLKPVTWFPPVWAYACGVVSAGVSIAAEWPFMMLGLLLAGPVVCGMSQAVNDWYDREVDAINEPHRPIPSGRIPGDWGWRIALAWTVLSLLVGALLGPWGFAATVVAVGCAWAYSAPPLRLKRNGWWGNAVCGACYEGLPWITGAAVMAAGAPDWRVVAAAALYSAGAHGIMTLNDFKSVTGDRRMGIRSLPVQLGPDRAARVACIVMAVPQVVVVALLLGWGATGQALAVGALLAAQLGLMVRLLRDPTGQALFYSATAIPFYVAGMMVTAFAIRGGA